MIFILILLIVAPVFPDDTLPNPYAGWKYAAEILVDNPDPFARPQAFVDAEVAVPLSRAANIPADVRAVTKRAFDTLDREIPSQVYALGEREGYKTFRVAFCVDVPANGRRRVALLYDNPRAKPSPGKAMAPGFAGFDTMGLPGGAAALCGITLARETDGRCLAVNAAFLPGEPRRDSTVAGPIFTSASGRRFLSGDGKDTVARLDFTWVAYEGLPFHLVLSRLEFLKRVMVFEIRNASLSFDRRRFSHYLFRPVTPSLPLTDVEEIGVVMVDSAHRSSFAEGFDLMAGMLKPDLAWQGLINTKRGTAVTLFQLERNRPVVEYRSAKRARIEAGRLHLFDGPVFVARRDSCRLAVPVAKGAVYFEKIAVHASTWNKDAWRSQVDGFGRQLNRPLRISVYPKTPLSGDMTIPVPQPYGTRADAYLRGVR